MPGVSCECGLTVLPPPSRIPHTGLVDLSTAGTYTWAYLKDTAVTAWMADPITAAATYGHISWWDVGHEARLENVFSANHNSVASFDEDVSHW